MVEQEYCYYEFWVNIAYGPSLGTSIFHEPCMVIFLRFLFQTQQSRALYILNYCMKVPGLFCFCQHNGACYFIIYVAWSFVVYKQILYSQTNYTRKLKVFSYQHPNYENRLFFSNFFLDHQKYMYFCHK